MTAPSVTKAFLLHFGISLIIFIALAAIMRIIWYPGDLFYMDGGLQGLKILAPIDLILGPALTLCFYRPWKKNIKFDMAAIATVQIAALSYGVFVTYQQRPAAIVFAENRFETLSLSEYKAATRELSDNDIAPRSINDFSSGMPVVLHARSFEDFGQYLEDVMNGLPELRERSDRYEAIADAREEIAKYRIGSQDAGTSIATVKDTGKDPGKITGETMEIPASSQEAASKEVITPGEIAEIYPLKARYDDGKIEFDPGSFQWISITRDPKTD